MTFFPSPFIRTEPVHDYNWLWWNLLHLTNACGVSMNTPGTTKIIMYTATNRQTIMALENHPVINLIEISVAESHHRNTGKHGLSSTGPRRNDQYEPLFLIHNHPDLYYRLVASTNRCEISIKTEIGSFPIWEWNAHLFPANELIWSCSYERLHCIEKRYVLAIFRVIHRQLLNRFHLGLVSLVKTGEKYLARSETNIHRNIQISTILANFNFQFSMRMYPSNFIKTTFGSCLIAYWPENIEILLADDSFQRCFGWHWIFGDILIRQP